MHPLIPGLGLSLALALAAQATQNGEILPKDPALMPQTTQAVVTVTNPDDALQKQQELRREVDVIQPVRPTGMGIDKMELLANWQDLPAEEAYGLFKDSGQTMPESLALQFNQSRVVNPWDPADRTAGGSPVTALPIPETAPGDSYSDHGDTRLLSNYLGNVPFDYNGACPTTVNFDANDAWYSFTLTAPTEVTATTCDDPYYYDTRLGVFDEDLDLVAGNDDNCPDGASFLMSTVTCCLEAGDYFVVVDGFGTNAGEYDLTVSFEACAAVDPPTRGGPDAFGYTWINSDDPEGPDYLWQDLTTVAQATPDTLGDDDFVAIPIGFLFRFYGVEQDTVYISSNGLLGFDPASMFNYVNNPIPTATEPNGIICPFWDDLNPSAGGTIHHFVDLSTGRLYIQWTGVPAFPSVGSFTFQAVLHRGGDIVFHYNDLMEDDLIGATVGIENLEGSGGLQVNYNGAGSALSDARSVRITYPRPTSGGPDAFGYTWANSQDADGPVYSVRDISAFTPLDITFDDQGAMQVLPFSFPFYGALYDTVYVSSNGYLTFDPADQTDFSNDAIPDAFLPNNIICGLWEDHNPFEGGTVHYADEVQNDRVIFQWEDCALYQDFRFADYSGRMTHQAVLYTDGTIEINYIDIIENALGSATVGLENADASDGLQAGYNGTGSVIADNTSLRFRPPAPEARPTRGGPTAGYAWANSHDPSGPEYLWQDISGSGVDLNIISDDQVVVQALPFAFPYFNGTYTEVGVCSNGWLSFDTSALPYFTNNAIPDASSQNNTICPFWDDLFPPAGGAIYYRNESANGRVIFQWNAVPHIGASTELYTFQVMLYSNGEIYINYEDMNTTGFYGVGSATVGVENADGTAGLQVNYNNAGGLIANGTTVAIMPSERPLPDITDLRIIPDGVYDGGLYAYFYYDWTPITTDLYGNTITIDHYDLYSSFDPYAPWPAGWFFETQVPPPPTPTYAHNPVGFFIRIAAVDEDGVIVAASPGIEGTRLSAEEARSLSSKEQRLIHIPEHAPER